MHRSSQPFEQQEHCATKPPARLIDHFVHKRAEVDGRHLIVGPRPWLNMPFHARVCPIALAHGGTDVAIQRTAAPASKFSSHGERHDLLVRHAKRSQVD